MNKTMYTYFHKKRTRGFTLIELLVVVAIISLISSVVLASLNTARAKARDTKRKQDMVQLRNALESYYLDYGSYPLAYGSNWGGVSTSPCGTNGQVSGANAYIQNLTPQYIQTLPVDPVTPGSCNGYLYYSNGTQYKLLVHQSAESYPSAGQPFYDPARPTWAWMVCNGPTSWCNTQ